MARNQGVRRLGGVYPNVPLEGGQVVEPGDLLMRNKTTGMWRKAADLSGYVGGGMSRNLADTRLLKDGEGSTSVDHGELYVNDSLKGKPVGSIGAKVYVEDEGHVAGSGNVLMGIVVDRGNGELVVLVDSAVLLVG